MKIKTIKEKRLEHSQKRFLERYGFKLTKKIRLDLEKLAIKENLINNNKKFNVYQVIYNKLEIRFIYSQRAKQFITFLPPIDLKTYNNYTFK